MINISIFSAGQVQWSSPTSDNMQMSKQDLAWVRRNCKYVDYSPAIFVVIFHAQHHFLQKKKCISILDSDPSQEEN